LVDEKEIENRICTSTDRHSISQKAIGLKHLKEYCVNPLGHNNHIREITIGNNFVTVEFEIRQIQHELED